MRRSSPKFYLPLTPKLAGVLLLLAVGTAPLIATPLPVRADPSGDHSSLATPSGSHTVGGGTFTGGGSGSPGSGGGSSSGGSGGGDLPTVPAGAQYCAAGTPDYWWWGGYGPDSPYAAHRCAPCPQPVAGQTPWPGSCPSGTAGSSDGNFNYTFTMAVSNDGTLDASSQETKVNPGSPFLVFSPVTFKIDDPSDPGANPPVWGYYPPTSGCDPSQSIDNCRRIDSGAISTAPGTKVDIWVAASYGSVRWNFVDAATDTGYQHYQSVPGSGQEATWTYKQVTPTGSGGVSIEAIQKVTVGCLKETLVDGQAPDWQSTPCWFGDTNWTNHYGPIQQFPIRQIEPVPVN